MPDASTPEQVGQALDALERVFLHLKDAHSLQHRVKGLVTTLRTLRAERLS
jgi:hypothetical protein